MTIDKAIEILEIETGSRHDPSDPDLYDAQRLGIEALEHIKEGREKGYDFFGHLPGETPGIGK